MSEHEPKPDGEVFYSLNVGGERLEATTENTSVWQHIGELAIYNCVMVENYVVVPAHPDYKELAYRAILNDCERHMSLRTVRRLFVQAFNVMNLTDLEATDSVPQEWLDKRDKEGGDSV